MSHLPPILVTGYPFAIVAKGGIVIVIVNRHSQRGARVTLPSFAYADYFALPPSVGPLMSGTRGQGLPVGLPVIGRADIDGQGQALPAIAGPWLARRRDSDPAPDWQALPARNRGQEAPSVGVGLPVIGRADIDGQGQALPAIAGPWLARRRDSDPAPDWQALPARNRGQEAPSVGVGLPVIGRADIDGQGQALPAIAGPWLARRRDSDPAPDWQALPARNRGQEAPSVGVGPLVSGIGGQGQADGQADGRADLPLPVDGQIRIILRRGGSRMPVHSMTDAILIIRVYNIAYAILIIRVYNIAYAILYTPMINYP